MKMLFTFCFTLSLSLITAASAQATTHVSHDYEDILNGIPLDNACVTATQVQTIRSAKMCLEKKEVVIKDDGINAIDYVCVKWSTKTLSFPRKISVQKCTRMKIDERDSSCAKYETQAKVLPNTIPVRTWTENGEYNNYPGTVSSFTFPTCK